MKNNVESTQAVSLEQMLEVLTSRIISSGKPVLVASDLDGTLASTHTFDTDLKVHVPNISRELVKAAQLLTIPLLIATGRSSNDPTINPIWEQLSRSPMPIIGENGGIVINPLNNKVLTSINSDDMNILRRATLDIESIAEELHTESIVPNNQEICIDKTRKTSREVRIQDPMTKIGSPSIHQAAGRFLKRKMGNDSLSIVCSDSSISIHPSSISKGKTVLAVLNEQNIDRSQVFIVALGDADNDESLFRIADLGIGVGLSTLGKSEITCLGGENTSIEIIKAIGKLHI